MQDRTPTLQSCCLIVQGQACRQYRRCSFETTRLQFHMRWTCRLLASFRGFLPLQFADRFNDRHHVGKYRLHQLSEPEVNRLADFRGLQFGLSRNLNPQSNDLLVDGAVNPVAFGWLGLCASQNGTVAKRSISFISVTFESKC